MKIKNLLPILICTLWNITAQAFVTVGSPLKVETEVSQWNTELQERVDQLKADGKYPTDGYTECRETIEVKGAYLCASAEESDMNHIFTRPALYAEANAIVVTRDSAEYAAAFKSYVGHDLRGEDLVNFWSAAEKFCEDSGFQDNSCADDYESDMFKNFFLPQAQSNANFVVISYAVKGRAPWRGVVIHEIMHAQYFNDPVYRATCDKYWESMTPDEQNEIRDALAPYYDRNNEFLMKNEFQAYILMNSDKSLLKDFYPKFRAPLMEQLELAGVKPIQVQ